MCSKQWHVVKLTRNQNLVSKSTLVQEYGEEAN
jgi:hypothetical protein